MNRVHRSRFAVLAPLAVVAVLAATWVGAALVDRPYARVVDVRVLEDPDGGAAFEEVSADGQEGRFVPADGPVVSLGYSGSAYWLRFPLDREVLPPDPHAVLEIASPNGESYELYVRRYREAGDGTEWSRQSLGLERPRYVDTPLATTWVFALPERVVVGSDAYLRVRSSQALVLPLRLWTLHAFQHHASWSLLSYGLVLGILLAMLVFNGFVWVVLRDRSHLLYLLYVAALMAYLARTTGVLQLVEPPALLQMPLLWTFAGLAPIFRILFTRRFLRTREHVPRLDVVLLGMCGLLLAGTGLGLAGLPRAGMYTVHASVLAGAVTAAVAAGVRLRQGFRSARYLVVATVAMALGVLAWSLVALPGGVATMPARALLCAGIAVEVVFASSALTDRMRMLSLEKQRLGLQAERLHALSVTDDLTGLPNRRGLPDRLQVDLRDARSLGAPLAIAMLDVDDFGAYNDRWGHVEGDRVLGTLGGVLRSTLRLGDFACRYGGEEFVLVLPGTPLDEATGAAERVRERMRDCRFGNDGRPVTVSAGVIAAAPGDDPEGLIRRADAALQQAKRAGKDRVVTA